MREVLPPVGDNDGGNGALSFPIQDSRLFGNFIADLLGQRRSIDQTFSDRRFVIDMNWLLNLDQVVEQRISAQNEAALVSFSARLYYANGKVLRADPRRV